MRPFSKFFTKLQKDAVNLTKFLTYLDQELALLDQELPRVIAEKGPCDYFAGRHTKRA